MFELLIVFNPIAHGPFITWLPQVGGWIYPPAKITLRSVRFQLFYTCIESYIQLAKIKKNSKKFQKRRRNRILKIFLEIMLSKRSSRK